MKLIRNSYYFLMEEESVSDKSDHIADMDVFIPDPYGCGYHRVKSGAASHIRMINWATRRLNKKIDLISKRHSYGLSDIEMEDDYE